MYIGQCAFWPAHGAVDEKEEPVDGSRHALVYRFCQICRRVLKWGEKYLFMHVETFTSVAIYLQTEEHIQTKEC